MSLQILISDDEITINETLKDDINIFEYVNRALEHYENKDVVKIYLLIKTDKQLIEIKFK